ncbi:hypothetical protein [Marinobacter sp. ELB17]|uniref:hypothetical protein n=1 Tax=Marinobacter sp. ELB17 TaxID=270374 RepID=UPI0000F39A54|nr:hypothetical protein [Marinobacter sp. ELB17]EAZ99762.1 hypothetical protein MELB17_12181 [Marinobacter sp. ELB17]
MHPKPATSEHLNVEAGGYLEAWRDQEETYEHFKSRTELNRAQWLTSAEWKIDELWQRNLSAIQKPEWLNDWVNFVPIRNETKCERRACSHCGVW